MPPRKSQKLDTSAFNADWLSSHNFHTPNPRTAVNRVPTVDSTPSLRARHETASTPNSWKARLNAQFDGSASSTLTPSRPTCSGARVTRPEEQIGGLNDLDVIVPRPKRSTPVGWQSNSVGSREDVRPSFVIASPPLVSNPSLQPLEILSDHEATPIPMKPSRKPTRDVPSDTSMSIKNLPDWIKPVWDAVSASLCDYYGAKENPWVLDHNDIKVGRGKYRKNTSSQSCPGNVDEDDAKSSNADFLELLQFLVDKLLPDEQHVVREDSQLYGVVSTLLF